MFTFFSAARIPSPVCFAWDRAIPLIFLCVYQSPISVLCNSSSVTAACFVFISLFSSPALCIYLFIYLLHEQELPEKWNNVRKQAVLVKQQVAPLQAIEVAGLRRKCASFDVEQHTFREHFRNNGPFRYNKYQRVWELFNTFMYKLLANNNK